MLIFSGIIAILIIASDWILRSGLHTRRNLTGSIRLPLQHTSLNPNVVSELNIQAPGQPPWRYVRVAGNWRYPEIHNAFVFSDPIEQFVSQILETNGTVVPAAPSEWRRFEVDPSSAVTVHLADSLRNSTTVHLGRALPGRNVNESYVRPGKSDTLFHIHANPLRSLGPLLAGKPPLLDPYILPRALTKSQIIRIDFYGNQTTIRSLERVEAPLRNQRESTRVPEGPVFDWLVRHENETETCNLRSTNAYIQYLRSFRHGGYAGPFVLPLAEETGSIRINYQSGPPDTLDVYVQEASKQSILKNRNADQIFRLLTRDTKHLFPSRSAVVDSLPVPSPYVSANPAQQRF
jgi:hypothetical protein